MTIANSNTSSFLKEAIVSYAQYTADKKQNAQKRALKWLQTYLESEQADPIIFEQFTQQWRVGNTSGTSFNEPPLNLENLPGSYKGAKSAKSINAHQDAALNFLAEQIPSEIQNGFQIRWNVKNSLKVSNADGAALKIDETDLAALQEKDPVGAGKTWYHLDKGDVYYLLSYEEKGDYYLITTTEGIGLENRDAWLVLQQDVSISSV